MPTAPATLALACCSCLLWGCERQRSGANGSSSASLPSPSAPSAPSALGVSSVRLSAPSAALPADPGPSELHVLAEGWEGTAEHANYMNLCIVGEVVSVCGSNLFAKDNGFAPGDAELARGMRYDAPVTGHLPNDVWTTSFGTPDECCDTMVLSRFTEGAWKREHVFKEVWEFAYRDYRLSLWWPGRMLAMFAPSCCEDNRMEFYSFGSGPKKALPKPKQQGGSRLMAVPGDMKAFGNGAVVVAGRTADAKHVVEVWRDPAQSSEVTVVPCGDRLGESQSLDDWVVFGQSEKRKPCAIRWVGGGWVDLQVPSSPGGDPSANWHVGSYAREPAGVEWIVLSKGGNGALLQRRAGGEWQGVRLPAARYSKTPVELQPTMVYAAADGDVWVQAHYKAQFDRGVILRTRKPSQVCWETKDRTRLAEEVIRCESSSEK